MKVSHCILTLSLLLGITLSAQAYGTPQDSYHLEFSKKEPRRIAVEARISLEDARLYMSPYGPMPERWDDYIENLEVYTEDGSRIAAIPAEDGGWDLEGIKPGQTALLRYDLVLDHEDIEWPGGIDGVAYSRDWGIMASGRSLFVMNGSQKEQIEVSISKPETWTVSVPWSSTEVEKYTVPNLTDLQESFIFAGSHREILMERDGFVLKFVLGGEAVLEQENRYKEVAQGVLDYYIGLMGGVPKPAPGLSFGQSMVIISASDAVDGEVIGNHISMFMNPEGDMMQQMMGWFMFAHEFFHLWNGKTLRFADSTTDWFKEGFSNYYTIKALHQIGFAGEQPIGMMLDGLFYQRYVNDPGFGTLAPADAASGFSKDNHWGLIYGGGLFAGIAIDMEIRYKSGNSSSLDDIMRYFYTEFGGSERLINVQDIVATAATVGGVDVTGLLDNCIHGTEAVPLETYLAYAGVLVETGSGHLELHHKESKTALEIALWDGFLGAQ